jgi:glycosyltransferase involved in cell wall biosynthesis
MQGGGVPDVSIVMSAWKPRIDWFRDAVGSALGQQGCDFELLVVDDGSPEPVAHLLRDVDDPRLRVLRVEHGGIAHTRNAGIRAARGRFFRFVDADDRLERGSTARLLALARDRETIAYGTTLVCDELLQPVGEKSSRLAGWVAEDCLLYRFDVKHMSMLFPRAVVEAVGDWDPSLVQCQDWDFVLRAVEHAPVRGDQEVASFYRRHGSSQSANLDRALHFESRVVERYFERHPEQRGTRLEREALAKLLMVRARAAGALGHSRREQLRLVGRALALHPRRATEELRQAVRPRR